MLYVMPGASGVTPMIQLIETILADPSDKTRIVLVFANRAQHRPRIMQHTTRVTRHTTGSMQHTTTRDRDHTLLRLPCDRKFEPLSACCAHRHAPGSVETELCWQHVVPCCASLD
jgi:ferredoxin-NADP reductase